MFWLLWNSEASFKSCFGSVAYQRIICSFFFLLLPRRARPVLNENGRNVTVMSALVRGSPVSSFSFFHLSWQKSNLQQNQATIATFFSSLTQIILHSFPLLSRSDAFFFFVMFFVWVRGALLGWKEEVKEHVFIGAESQIKNKSNKSLYCEALALF